VRCLSPFFNTAVYCVRHRQRIVSPRNLGGPTCLCRNDDSKATPNSIAFVPSRSPRESFVAFRSAKVALLSRIGCEEMETGSEPAQANPVKTAFLVGAAVALPPQSNRSHAGRRLIHFLPNHYPSAQQPSPENMPLSFSFAPCEPVTSATISPKKPDARYLLRTQELLFPVNVAAAPFSNMQGQ
jgi:hypothetical protein